MIAVIADDFTGAAEIGGIGLHHGLDVTIETEPIRNHGADLLVIATDTRSMSPEDAMKLTASIAKGALELNPSLIFKKVDSVLRGNITEELVALMEAAGKSRAVVIAANPAFKRVVKDGIYYIDGVPLAQTCFSSDPEFPISTSSVAEILRTYECYPLYNQKPGEALPEKGIVIGDVNSVEDLQEWAAIKDDKTLLAGASGFFNALLKNLNLQRKNNRRVVETFGEKALFILGSAYPKDSRFIERLSGADSYVSNMPRDIYFNRNYDPQIFNAWVDETVRAIEEHKRVFVTVAHSGGDEPNLGARLAAALGELTKRVVETTEVHELLIEGGSTTSMVLSCLGIKKLKPLQEVEPGVIRMQVEGGRSFRLTTKPGSYMWPEGVWIASDVERLNNLN